MMLLYFSHARPFTLAYYYDWRIRIIAGKDYTGDMSYFVYLLQCKDNTIYTGITTDVARRFAEHKAKKGGHYTASHGARKMIYTERRPNRGAALRREAEIKKWSRGKKLAFVKSKESV